jgi:hypothetical protein
MIGRRKTGMRHKDGQAAQYVYPARLNPTRGGKLAARPVPRRCLAKALTNLAPGLFEAGRGLVRLVPVKNVYLCAKGLP